MRFDKAGYYILDETTRGQPFPAGAGGCAQFRIPGIITLDDGDYFAVCDARWNDAKSDYGGIDTIFSVSGDGGKTWRPGYAAMFPDTDGTPSDPHDATCCIDPCVVQDGDSVIHILVNMHPTGITPGLVYPNTGTGFIKADGRKRLAVTPDHADADTPPSLLPSDKLFYVGDYSGGFAPVLKAGGEETGYAVDEYFNIYETVGGRPEPLCQDRIGSEEKVRQNLFYRDSRLHVYNTTYTLSLTSKDKGATWNAEIISDKIKREDEAAFISSPGNGTLTSDGTVLLPFYRNDGAADRSASVIVYTRDGFKTFHRTPPVPANDAVPWSGECKAVELSDRLWRLFVRNGTGYICYADFDVERFEWLDPVRTDVKVHSECDFSAIKSGNEILVSYPAGAGPESRGRVNGRLYTFALDESFDMELVGDEQIEEGAFSYSCLASDGEKLNILVDTCEKGRVFFRRIR